jgi:nitrile hydratase
MLADGSKAAEELGLDVGPLKLIVVENTDDVHNVIVCTLCSCYPRMLLGLPPDWYKSRNYRSRVVREPRTVLAEFGTTIPDDVQIRVHDSTADMRYMVAPKRPQGTEGLSEAELASLVTRDSMIGVALAEAPKK